MNDVKETITLRRRMFYAAVPAASITVNLCIAAWAMHADPDVGSWAVWRLLLLAVPFMALLNAFSGPWSGYVEFTLTGFAITIILWMMVAILCALFSLWQWTLYLPSSDGVFSVAVAAIIFTIAVDLPLRARASGFWRP